MSIDNQLLFCYLEEDNVQAAYFRVRPLLTPEADIREEAQAQFPTDGCLRIVPDRNELHTFKNRMRSLGAYCLVDLHDLPNNATKIRTNKNFRPDHGEPNQFILYSDTVRPLPEHSFYEIIAGTAEDFAAAAEKAVTPLFYIRQDDVLYGPVRKASPEKPEKSGELSALLFTLPCPDGVERTLLCVKDAPAVTRPAPVARQARQKLGKVEPVKAEPVKPDKIDKPEKTEKAPEEPTTPPPATASTTTPTTTSTTASTDEALPIGQALNILDASKGFEETLHGLDKPLSGGANLLHHSESRPAKLPPSLLKSEPLTGTPLVRTPLRTATPPSKNRVQEMVSSQWYVGKYEPPTQNLPNGTAMRPIDNPVAEAVNAFRNAWRMPDVREQLMDFVLSLEGLRSRLEPRICKDRNVTALQRVLRDRLQDLEAERLTALCQLDKARRDVDAYRQEIITGMTSRLQKETGKLEDDRAACEERVSALKQELNTLTLQRDTMLEHINSLQNDALPATISKLLNDLQLALPITGQPLRLSPVSGVQADLDEMLRRLTEVCQQSGLTLDRNMGLALLILLAISNRIGLSSPTPAPVATLARNIAAAMGWQHSFAHQIATEQRPMTALRPVDATPALLMTSLPNYAPITGTHKLLLARSTAALTRNAAYDASQWPVLPLLALSFVPELPENAQVQPISEASLLALAEKVTVSDAEIDTVLNPIFALTAPLSGAAKKELYRFIGIAASLMEGGLPTAVDWGILLWLVPGMERSARNYAELKALLDEYPLSQAQC